MKQPAPLLSFDEIKTRRKGQVEFTTVAARDFTEVKRQISPFGGKMEPNIEVFRDQLFARIKAVHGLDVERVVAYWVPAHDEHRLCCIAYQAGRRVSTLAFEVAGNLRAWIDALTKPFARTAGIDLLFTPNQAGYGSCAPAQLAELAANPIKLIKRWAPDHFDLAGLARDKRKFFKNFEDVPGPLEAFDPARFAALLDELLALREHRGAAPQPAAVDAWQARLEQQVGARLPEAFTALYRRLDGAAGLFFGNDLLTTAAVERESAGWRVIYEEWTIQALKSGHTSERGVTYPVYCTSRWIPFIDLVGGNYVALDLIPAPRGHYGQIIVFGADVQRIRRIAGDLPQFLQQCLGYDGRKAHPLHDVFADLAL